MPTGSFASMFLGEEGSNPLLNLEQAHHATCDEIDKFADSLKQCVEYGLQKFHNNNRQSKQEILYHLPKLITQTQQKAVEYRRDLNDQLQACSKILQQGNQEEGSVGYEQLKAIISDCAQQNAELDKAIEKLQQLRLMYNYWYAGENHLPQRPPKYSFQPSAPPLENTSIHNEEPQFFNAMNHTLVFTAAAHPGISIINPQTNIHSPQNFAEIVEKFKQRLLSRLELLDKLSLLDHTERYPALQELPKELASNYLQLIEFRKELTKLRRRTHDELIHVQQNIVDNQQTLQPRMHALELDHRLLNKISLALDDIELILIHIQGWLSAYQQNNNHIPRVIETDLSKVNAELIQLINNEYPPYTQIDEIYDKIKNLPQRLQHLITTHSRYLFWQILIEQLPSYNATLEKLNNRAVEELNKLTRYQKQFFFGRSIMELVKIFPQTDQQAIVKIYKLHEMMSHARQKLNQKLDELHNAQNILQAQQAFLQRWQMNLPTENEYATATQLLKTTEREHAILSTQISQIIHYQANLDMQQPLITRQQLFMLSQQLQAIKQRLSSWRERLADLTADELKLLRQQRLIQKPSEILATVPQLLELQQRLQQCYQSLLNQTQQIETLLTNFAEYEYAQIVSRIADLGDLWKIQKISKLLSEQLRELTITEASQQELTVIEKALNDENILPAQIPTLRKKLKDSQEKLKQLQEQFATLALQLGGNLSLQQLQLPPLNLERNHAEKLCEVRHKVERSTDQLTQLRRRIDNLDQALMAKIAPQPKSTKIIQPFSEAHLRLLTTVTIPVETETVLSESGLPVTISPEKITFYPQSHLPRTQRHAKAHENVANYQSHHEEATIRLMIKQANFFNWKPLCISVPANRKYWNLVLVACAYAAACGIPVNYDSLPDSSFRSSKEFQALLTREQNILAKERAEDSEFSTHKSERVIPISTPIAG